MKSISYGPFIRDKTSSGIRKTVTTCWRSLKKMYDLGVRSFAVFFDDISGEGTNPVKQAELLNYIDENFVKVKKDVTPPCHVSHRV